MIKIFHVFLATFLRRKKNKNLCIDIFFNYANKYNRMRGVILLLRYVLLLSYKYINILDSKQEQQKMNDNNNEIYLKIARCFSMHYLFIYL